VLESPEYCRRRIPGPSHPQPPMFRYVSIKDRIPADWLLRRIKALVNPILAAVLQENTQIRQRRTRYKMPSPTQASASRRISSLSRRANAFHKQLSRESDRACVIISVAMLDDAVTDLLQATLVAVPQSKETLLGEGYAPLGSFGPRCDLAYRLGLVDAQFLKALHQVRRLRNEVAHRTERFGFGMRAIRERMREFGAIQHIEILPAPNGPRSTRQHFERGVTWMLFVLWTLRKRASQCQPAPHEGVREHLSSSRGAKTPE